MIDELREWGVLEVWGEEDDEDGIIEEIVVRFGFVEW